MINSIALKVEAPFATFRKPHAREFAESYTIPPPTTVYGMLLSMVGEIDRKTHIGVKLAIVPLNKPTVNVVFRTAWRVKNKKISLGCGENRRIDYKQVLTDVRFAIYVDSSEERCVKLVDRLRCAIDNPASIVRYGALSIGESDNLINIVEELKNDSNEIYPWLIPDRRGNITLPIWADHLSGVKTRWVRFKQVMRPLNDPKPDAFVMIEPLA